MNDDLIKRLATLADCDARAGEPLGKCMREAAAALAEAQAEISRLREALAEWQVAGQYADDQLRRLGSDGYASGLTGLLARAALEAKTPAKG